MSRMETDIRKILQESNGRQTILEAKHNKNLRLIIKPKIWRKDKNTNLVVGLDFKVNNTLVENSLRFEGFYGLLKKYFNTEMAYAGYGGGESEISGGSWVLFKDKILLAVYNKNKKSFVENLQKHIRKIIKVRT